MVDNLKNKAITGMLWSLFQRFGTMGISFVSNIILARLLTPEDYGCIGMLMIFILIANTFIDGGFGSALIQKKEPSQKDYSTIFYWNILISVILYTVLYVCAPVIASFYDISLLSFVLRVQGIVLVINALSIIQSTQLRKQLKFKKIASINITSAVISVIIAIILAYRGWGIWSLVAQQLLFSFFNALFLWILNKWFPSLVFSRKSFSKLFGFGTYILFSNLFNTFCNNIQGVLIGKFFSPMILGYYTQSRKLEEVASTSISNVMDQVSYPIFSEYQNDKVALGNILKKFILSLAYFSIPLMTVLILIARPLIVLVYSAKWEPCVPYFQILCIAGIAVSLQGVNYYAVAAIGKSKELFIRTIIIRTIGLIIVTFGLVIGGLWGLLVGVVVTSYILYIANAYLVSKYIRYKLRHQFRDLSPILLLSALLYLIVWGITQWLDVNIYILGCVQLLLYAVLYASTSFLLFKLESALFFKDIIKSILRKHCPDFEMKLKK